MRTDTQSTIEHIIRRTIKEYFRQSRFCIPEYMVLHLSISIYLSLINSGYVIEPSPKPWREGKENCEQ